MGNIPSGGGGGGGAPSGPAGGDLAGTYPNPTIPAKQSGLPVQAATFSILPFSPTYNNGSSGVGATLTAGSAGALTLNGYTVALGDRILYGGRGGGAALQNGIYTVTTLGTASVPYVLTRATDYDTPVKINSGSAISVLGTDPVYSGTSWALGSIVGTVGTNPVLWNEIGSKTVPPYLAYGQPPNHIAPLFQVTTPPTTGYTDANLGGTTITQPAAGNLLITWASNLGNNQVRAHMQTLPASNGYTAIVGQTSPGGAVGMCISDGTQFIIVWRLLTGKIQAYKFNTATSLNATYFSDFTGYVDGNPFWMRFRDDNTNRMFEISTDGFQTWTTVDTQPKNTFLTETLWGPAFETNSITCGTNVFDLRATTP